MATRSPPPSPSTAFLICHEKLPNLDVALSIDGTAEYATDDVALGRSRPVAPAPTTGAFARIPPSLSSPALANDMPGPADADARRVAVQVLASLSTATVQRTVPVAKKRSHTASSIGSILGAAEAIAHHEAQFWPTPTGLPSLPAPTARYLHVPTTAADASLRQVRNSPTRQHFVPIEPDAPVLIQGQAEINKDIKSEVKVENSATEPKVPEILAPVERILADKNLYKRLLLSMALEREKPKTRCKSDADEIRCAATYSFHSGPMKIIGEGFFWKDFPILENILHSHMAEYYELSTVKRQSKDQQLFNNRLVALIQKKAAQNGWEFDPAVFHEKKLRDRIRCFFKSHIQNAKKRLNTMLKQPHKKRNLETIQTFVQKIGVEAESESSNDKEKRNVISPFPDKTAASSTTSGCREPSPIPVVSSSTSSKPASSPDSGGPAAYNICGSSAACKESLSSPSVVSVSTQSSTPSFDEYDDASNEEKSTSSGSGHRFPTNPVVGIRKAATLIEDLSDEEHCNIPAKRLRMS